MHDSVLAGVQGLLWTLREITQCLASNDSSRDKLEQALAIAEQLLLEGRDCVYDLRMTALPGGLHSALYTSGHRLAAETGMSFDMRVEGTPRTLSDHASHEAHRIAMEAMRNAFRHSKGSTVRLGLSYRIDGLSVEILDDGIGLDQADGEGTDFARWGMIGMRERAASLGTTLICSKREDRGTRVCVDIEASIAYAPTSRSCPGVDG